ncbi:MAG: c-type cytochrome domain-containing protein, partial [Verrucomicrobiota bacterium]
MRPTLLFLLAALPATAADLPREHTEFFEAKVRPLLADKCYQCHSAASGKQKGGLSLDTKDGWLQGGESGPAIVPGKPDDSPFIRAIRYDDPDLQMPPRGLPRSLQDMVTSVSAELARLDVSHPGAPGLANVLYDESRPKNSRILIRGQAQNPGPEVPRSFLEVLSNGSVSPFTSGSGRRELADAIASPENPLTPRVIVNRI